MATQHYGESFGGSAPENYEHFFVPTIGAPLAEDLIERAALRPGERVLDAACGTGAVTRLAARDVGGEGAVAGLDVNPGMLAVARAATPPGVTIDWHEASAEEMPLPEASFDVVLCQMGLQFVPDRSAALSEMRRVLDSGGRVALNVPGPTPPLFDVMGKAIGTHLGAEPAQFVDQVFSLHDTEEIRGLMVGAGFRDVSLEADTRSLRLPAPEDFLWQYVHSTPIAGAVAQMDDEGRFALEREVVQGWQDFVSDHGLDLRVRVVVATARR